MVHIYVSGHHFPDPTIYNNLQQFTIIRRFSSHIHISFYFLGAAGAVTLPVCRIQLKIGLANREHELLQVTSTTVVIRTKMNYHLLLTIAITSLYTVLIFLIAWYAHKCRSQGTA
jgi:hypothetical protein